MSRVGRIAVAPGVSIRGVLQAVLARKGPPVAISAQAFAAIARECGGDDAALRWLERRVQYARRPIFANTNAGAGRSITVALAPRDWSRSRLLGYVGGVSELLIGEFGQVDRIFDPAKDAAS